MKLEFTECPNCGTIIGPHSEPNHVIVPAPTAVGYQVVILTCPNFAGKCRQIVGSYIQPSG
ncbi:MAG: hypothetical protein QOF08_1231 [Gaiellales bacterium]|jgi:hypothetical protein|nr:hypothetical protein [Gaiellales bacterium]